MSLNCDSIDRNKKNISLTNVTNSNGEFNFFFEVLGAYGKSITCMVILTGTVSMKSANATVVLNAPNYS